MASACAESLLTAWSQVSESTWAAMWREPACAGRRRHPLSAMLTAVVCGLLRGNRGDKALAEWLHDLPVDVWHWMGDSRRPPKQDCFRDLMMKLDPDALEEVLRTWITGTLELETDPVALPAESLDGKTLCGTLRPFARAVHLLLAVDHQTGCVLSQCRVTVLHGREDVTRTGRPMSTKPPWNCCRRSSSMVA